MKLIYAKRAVKSINKINPRFKQNIKKAIEKLPVGDIKRLKGQVNTRQQLRDMIDVVDTEDMDTLFQILIKFIPYDNPLPDEIEAIRLGREEIMRGEYVTHDEIDWG